MNPWLRPILFLLLLALGAAHAAEEPTLELERFKVDETPIAFSGIAYSHPNQHFSLLPSSRPYYVVGVLEDSPADKAGVFVGEQIVAINGERTARLTAEEIYETFFHGKAGDRLKLTLADPLAGKSREVTIERSREVTSLTWAARKEITQNFWGVRLTYPAGVKMGGAIAPLRRSMRERRCVLGWGGSHLTLIERPGVGLVIKDGDFRRPTGKAEPPGRFVPMGATINFHADGTYDIKP